MKTTNNNLLTESKQLNTFKSGVDACVLVAITSSGDGISYSEADEFGGCVLDAWNDYEGN